jgi:molybdopterin synthase catalytic subunit
VDAGVLARRVRQASDGAVVSFDGVVRNHSQGRPTLYLEYHCYEAMALREMARIGLEVVAGHAVGRLAVVHRLGRLEIGETSVAIAVAAPHRGPAFEAARAMIDRLKKSVPIWKKEYFVDGAAWVAGEWDDSLRNQ